MGVRVPFVENMNGDLEKVWRDLADVAATADRDQRTGPLRSQYYCAEDEFSHTAQ